MVDSCLVRCDQSCHVIRIWQPLFRQPTDGDLVANDVMKQQLDAHKALATLQSEGDALVWLLNGLHMLSRRKQLKSIAHCSQRAAVAHRIRFVFQE